MTPSAMLTTDPRHSEPRFYGSPTEIVPDVFMHPVFVNTYAVRTSAGLLLIDPGLADRAPQVHAAIRAWSPAPVHTVIYTHGHADHAFGLAPFLAAGERPAIVAQANCPQRFARYGAMQGWNARINQRQFGLPRPSFPSHFDWPTVLVDEEWHTTLGDLEVHATAARGETDDGLFVWIPARGYLFCGDLVIWQAPNCGNPQKVQRYPVEWAAALERMAALEAECLFPGHGLVVLGQAAVRTLLLDTAAYLRGLIEQVRTRMNAGETPETIIHAVAPDPTLAHLPYLRATYDHPAFIVRNLLRAWGGWWDGNAANLLPASSPTQAAEIAQLAGGVAPIVARGRTLLDAGASTLAAHLAEWATRADATDRAAQMLKRDVYARRLAEEPALMAQGIFRAAMEDAERALGETPAPRPARRHDRMDL
jgi:glyoxylase-like metal-dependent hydrolase (beta-lactamase superfamily II)